jgi:MoxR-like ATPase
MNELSRAAGTLREALGRVVVGQAEPIDALLAAYMAGGHALIEGVPGIAKTLLARAFAAALGVEMARIQATPDLMPADVLGTNVFDPKSGTFHLVRGPIFTQLLMADEINRTPPKTQSALLEAMQEGRVTLDGVSHALAAGFFVIATQNPLEFEGVYPLPEAQLDRFLVKIDMSLPSADAEREILRRAVAGELAGWSEQVPLPSPVMGPEEALALRRAAERVHVADDLLDYLAKLAAAVRRSPHVELGPSPRGTLALLALARAGAFLEEREFVLPDDLKRFLSPCWSHRLLLTAEAELEGYTARRILDEAAATVEVPRR